MHQSSVSTLPVATGRISKLNTDKFDNYKTTTVVGINNTQDNYSSIARNEERFGLKTKTQLNKTKLPTEDIITVLKNHINSSKCIECKDLRSQANAFLDKLSTKLREERMESKLANSTIVDSKERKIKELEKLVEDQRRLRLQDASQVEEKAAKIKEWVSNKLKELENQNRQLREQNKKQKDQINQLIETSKASCEIDNIEDKNSLYQRNKPNDSSTKHRFVRQNSELRVNNSPYSYKDCFISDELQTRALLSPRRTNVKEVRQESPIYDSVTIDYSANRSKFQSDLKNGGKSSPPPPPPMHQFEKWELKLYRLADESFSSMVENSSEDSSEKSPTFSSQEFSYKSPFGTKNELIALLNPSFTTIDGERIVDFASDKDDNQNSSMKTISIDSMDKRKLSSQQSFECLSIPSTPITKPKYRNAFFDQKSSISNSRLDLTSSESPIKRASRDNIFRTQSIRRYPLPQKLYEFVAADLVKRSTLIKLGKLKSHSRWVVLRDFHLLIYKSQADETAKELPLLDLRLQPKFQISISAQANESSFPFKIVCPDKCINLSAEDALIRNEWLKMLSLAINLSDIDSEYFCQSNMAFDGLVCKTRHALNKKTYAALFGHILVFLKSQSDPTPQDYVSIKEATIREITDCYNYDEDISIFPENKNDSIISIHPRYTHDSSPIYIIIPNQQETDNWIYYLSTASSISQSYGSIFEHSLSNIMINDSLNQSINFNNSDTCKWKYNSILTYTDKAIDEPLTTLQNETLRNQAVEMFRSILLYSQVPIEHRAIDYHVCLLQNCLSKFMDLLELRNEFFAQLIKQITFVNHSCQTHNGSETTKTSECCLISDFESFDYLSDESSSHLISYQGTNVSATKSHVKLTLATKVKQIMQILAVAISLDIPKGRIRSWFLNHIHRLSNEATDIGKYALYIIKAFERTKNNGPREMVPSRREILGIITRNPYDHSHPHSLPVNFCDKSYVLVEVDGSTTAKEFMQSIIKQVDVRDSEQSDFYIFADDPVTPTDIHILEPHRKIFDSVSWWEQAFKHKNSGRNETSRAIKLVCKKRLALITENDETEKEKHLIVYQIHHEIITRKINVPTDLSKNLCALMAQMMKGDIKKVSATNQDSVLKSIMETDQIRSNETKSIDMEKIKDEWKSLEGLKIQDCVRIYLNCVRKISSLFEKTN